MPLNDAKRGSPGALLRTVEGRSRFLAEATDLLTRSLDFETTLDTLAHLPVPELAAACVVDTTEAGVDGRVGVACADSALEARLVAAVRSGRESEAAEGAARERLYRALGFDAPIVVPLLARRSRLGTMTLLGAVGAAQQGADARRLVEEIARRAALALDNARLYELALEARAEAEAAERRARFLAGVGTILEASLDDAAAALRLVAHVGIPHLADWCLVELRTDAGAGGVEVACADPADQAPLAEAARRAAPESIAGRVARTGEPELLAGPTTELLETLAPGLASAPLASGGPQSLIAVPLVARGVRLGAMVFASTRPERRYGEDDLALAEELARRAALMLDNARLLGQTRQAESRYRLLFEGNPQPMWVHGLEDERVLAVNEAAVRLYGYSREEFRDRTRADLVAPGEPAGTDGAPGGPERHRKRSGEVVHVECTVHELEFDGRPARLVLVQDVTERVRADRARAELEEQLRQAQKMEAVGRLAGGVAHDFNNLLTGILGYSDLIIGDLPEHDPLREDMEEIKRSAGRAASLTRQLLAFSRRQMLQPRVLALNGIVAELQRLLRRLIGEDIELRTRLQPALGWVKADPGQIEQVIVNLVVNARDAMPDGGTITVETVEVEIDREYVDGHAGVPPGRYIVLAVADTGVGMDRETQERIFEPFFTTKEQGKGTGLGLSTVYGIVKQSGGHIRVASRPGLGTTFRLYLPRVDEDPGHTDGYRLTHDVLGGTETILLVEDERVVRELTRRILQQRGYHVLEAQHGAEALELAERYRGPIELLLTDVVMPRMSGRELAERIAALRPDTRILFMSGYTDDVIDHSGVLDTDAALVAKPFTPEAIARRVREALDAAPR